MSNNAFASLLAFLLLVTAATVTNSQSCPCRLNFGTCNSIDLIQGGSAPRCASRSTACSGCICDNGDGPMACKIAPSSVYRFNGTADFCSLATRDASLCPPTIPAFLNATTCCSFAVQGSVSNQPCILRSWSSFKYPRALNQIYRWIDSSANVTTTYNNPSNSEIIISTSVQATLDFFYAQTVPPVFYNLTTQTVESEPDLLPPQTSLTESYLLDFNTALTRITTTGAPAPLFTQLRDYPGATVAFNENVRFNLAGPGGTSRTIQAVVRQCVAYEYSSTNPA